MAGKGSKNNVANRGTGARAKFYDNKKVIPILLKDRKNNKNFIAAIYEDGPIVTSPDGNYVEYRLIPTDSTTDNTSANKTKN